jgi:SAM-dependent methyltransferase
LDHILRTLNSTQTVLDLGCGNGSFRYDHYLCRIIAVDHRFETPRDLHCDARVDYIEVESSSIPLASSTIDFVICHHTLEHFATYRTTLDEIRRVLKPDGILWIAVPNGFGLDDSLYRFMFKGGGHVNRFSKKALIDEVQELTGTHLIQTIDLFSGFVYVKRPLPNVLPYLPRRAKLLACSPTGINIAMIFILNIGTRLLDRVFNTRLSQYGWGFVFARQAISVESQLSCFNVCWQCGAGHSAAKIALTKSGRWFGFCFYTCSLCHAVNASIPPPLGVA